MISSFHPPSPVLAPKIDKYGFPSSDVVQPYYYPAAIPGKSRSTSAIIGHTRHCTNGSKIDPADCAGHTDMSGNTLSVYQSTSLAG